jgi:predicted flap endonuclease-1-like 5' DNA nuclease
MSYSISEIEGIGPKYAKILVAGGIKTTAALLKAGGTPKGRKSLEDATGLSGKRILEWCNHADLMRITGVGKQFAELLEAAGVDTVKELRNRNAANLATAMKVTNAKKKLSKSSPSESMAVKWIAQAKTLKPAIRY